MKKIVSLMLMLVSVIGVANADDVYTQDRNVLPAQARTTLTKHFPKKGINHIKIDKHFLGSDDYEVVLNDGTEIEFNGKGEVKEVDARTGVPASLMLNSINNYVKKNCRGAKVVKFEVNRNDYEVELSNGLEMKFDRSGKFLRMTD